MAPAHPPLAHPNLASGLNKISAIAVGLEIRGVRGKGARSRAPESAVGNRDFAEVFLGPGFATQRLQKDPVTEAADGNAAGGETQFLGDADGLGTAVQESARCHIRYIPNFLKEARRGMRMKIKIKIKIKKIPDAGDGVAR